MTTLSENTARIASLMSKTHPGDEKEIIAAIGKGIHCEYKNMMDDTFIGWATWRGLEDTVKALLDAGADVNARQENGCNALIYTMKLNTRPELAKILVSAGADMFMKDNYGQSPYDYAKTSSPKIFAIFEDHIARSVTTLEHDLQVFKTPMRIKKTGAEP